jgi:hypothetical protein
MNPLGATRNHFEPRWLREVRAPDRLNVLSRRPVESPPVAFLVENSSELRHDDQLHLTDSEHYGK